jgi:DNA-damage-inducible protein J
MAAQTSMLQVSVEDEIREKATVALRAKGLSLSDAVRLFLLRVANDPAFTWELEVPNAETRAAMAEAEEIARTRRARFVTADELFDDLATTNGKKAGRAKQLNRLARDTPRQSLRGALATKQSRGHSIRGASNRTVVLRPWIASLRAQ